MSGFSWLPIFGTPSADVINGTGMGDTIYGLGGNDHLKGFGGADCLYGGDGGDGLFGGDGSDTLYGENGSDHLCGDAGNDILHGGDGRDRLDGGVGADYMSGGVGDDTYWVDDAGDVVVEAPGAGYDIVNTYIDYVMPGWTELVQLLGSAAINATGNDDDNMMEGNSAANVLLGGLGHDALHGRDGHDTLDGGAGNDDLFGGYGTDTMTGGSGADLFFYYTIGETYTQWSIVGMPGTGPAYYLTYDHITDFSDAEGDAIDLGSFDANTLISGDQAFLWIGNDNSFYADTDPRGQLRFNFGYVEGDTDGDLDADFRIQVDAPPSLHDYAFVL